MASIPDYSNIKFSVKDMQRFLKDGNVKLDKKELENLHTIFNKFDTVNSKGEKKADGELSINEDRDGFMAEIEEKMPELSDNLVEFLIVVNLMEEYLEAEAAYKNDQGESKKFDQKT